VHEYVRKDKRRDGSHSGDARTHDDHSAVLAAPIPVGHKVKSWIVWFLGQLLTLALLLGRGWRDERVNHSNVSSVAITMAAATPTVVAWRVARHCDTYHRCITMLAGLAGNGRAILARARHELVATRNAATHTHGHLPKVCNDLTVNCLVRPWERPNAQSASRNDSNHICIDSPQRYLPAKETDDGAFNVRELGLVNGWVPLCEVAPSRAQLKAIVGMVNPSKLAAGLLEAHEVSGLPSSSRCS
jgi:hypothetical protein